MKILDTEITYIQEKLKAPFGFKGGYLTELWQVVCKVSTKNNYGVGVGVQSVLWSDANIFISNSEQKGNEYMYVITKKALELIKNKEFDTPITLIDSIYEELLTFAKTTISSSLRETFVKNALVSVDNALWQLYAKENNTINFLDVVPTEYKKAFIKEHNMLCNIPLISYGVSKQDIASLLDTGKCLLKIKIGYDNNGKMSKKEMVEWDKNRLLEIHSIAKNYKTNYSTNGNILYYLDANGKYDTIERLNDFLSFAESIGAKENVVLLEEPFEEDNKIDVSSVSVRLASDESVHSLKDVEERINLGYKAIALKPIAKTMSETLKILNKAYENNVICFCADLTVNPLLVEWNKNFASRINTLPEMKIGILESNGEQNYLNWEVMKTYSNSFYKNYSKQINGVYILNSEFYNESGLIFTPSNYYDNLFKN